MKSRAQKQKELEKGRDLLKKSSALVFVDFTKVPTEALRKLRKEIKAVGGNLLLIKKRLLGILLKEIGAGFDPKTNKFSLGTIFSEGDIEKISAPVYKFFASLDVPDGGAKDMWVKHIIDAYDVNAKAKVGAEQVIFIGKLPPREVLLAQLFGMLAAPLRSFMYLLQEKSKQTQ